MEYNGNMRESQRNNSMTLEFGTEQIELAYQTDSKDDDDSGFHQFHEKCLKRIKYKKVCSCCGEEVNADGIVMAKGKDIPEHEPFRSEEFDKYKFKKKCELIGMEKNAEIPEEFVSKTVTLFPQDETQLKAFVKLLNLAGEKSIITKIVLASRERNAVISKHPKYKSLLRCFVLRYPHEVRNFEKLNEKVAESIEKIKLTPFEVAQIQSLTNVEYQVDEKVLKDTQKEMINEFLRARILNSGDASGKELVEQIKQTIEKKAKKNEQNE
jgi:non-homologous end joining protein Ku